MSGYPSGLSLCLAIICIHDMEKGIDSACIKYYTIPSNTKHYVFKRGAGCYMNDKYERQMKKGVLDMLVLKLLENDKKYGYQLIQELREKSGDIFCLKEGTLYPILYRLEDEKLVESSWCEPEVKQVPRKYYMITQKGEKELAEIYGVWRQIAEGAEEVMRKRD